MPCELCDAPGGELLWQDELCRAVLVHDPDYPGFCRVILKRHTKEMAELSRAEQQQVMRVVFAVEQALTKLMRPEKINLASLGNVVPHIHWHVIPRFSDDAHFPQPIWAAAVRTGAARVAPDLGVLRITLDELLQTPYD
jgi:diadenosine tetraphosphate (Ap4A) HIT family hydrolase